MDRIYDAWRAVLLSLVPNLETLTMEWHPVEKYTGKILTRASNREMPFDTHPAFTRLRSVSIPEWDCDDTPIIADDIMHFFRFSSLRQFSAYGVADSAHEDEASTIKKAWGPFQCHGCLLLWEQLGEWFF
jgi:hypothetical protein